ncbi:hypothetical protein R0K05_21885, partial [Planococcus sp. SIMBA_160]
RYLNARDGVAGMAVLLLLAGLGLALFRRRARVLALVAIAAFVLLFCQIQYLRYVHPVMVLSIPAALSGLALAGRASTWQAAGWLAVA